MQCIPPTRAVTRDTVADDKPKRTWPGPRIRRVKVNPTRSGPSAEPTAVEDVNYRPTSTERQGRCFERSRRAGSGMPACSGTREWYNGYRFAKTATGDPTGP